VLVPFPFSDLSRAKLRPALALADVGNGDWVLCQITSNPYSDRKAVELRDQDFTSGSLRRASFARPGKLFTANQSLFRSETGTIGREALIRVVDEVVGLLRPKTTSA
jgi:mRNA interferase MazF